MSDDELVEKIKCGDEAAAKELIDRYYGAILRYCGWHCSAPERAEDLTQETFLKLFRSLPKYHGRNKFKSYLYTIANRLCIDERYSYTDAAAETGSRGRRLSSVLDRISDLRKLRK